VTALLTALRDPHRIIKVDEVRRVIEDMPPEDYRRLDYFEKWAVGAAALVVEKGLMTRDEIDRRLADLKQRQLPESTK
jgi:Nitrile hydratase beta subunit